MYMKKYFLCEGALQIRAPLEGGFLVVPEKILMSKVTYLNVRSNAGGPCKIRVGVVGGNLVETTKQLYFVHLFFFGIVSPNRLPTRKTVRRARRAAGEQRGANMGRMEWTGTEMMGGGVQRRKIRKRRRSGQTHLFARAGAKGTGVLREIRWGGPKISDGELKCAVNCEIRTLHLTFLVALRSMKKYL